MASFLPPDPTVERRARELGEQLLARMDAAPAPGIFSSKGAHARVMEWAMRDPAFKAQLFRFVDVLPSLTSAAEIVRHLQEYLGDQAVELHPALKAGLAASSFAPALIAGPVKSNIVSLARQFVAGETPDDLVRQLRTNARLGLATTIDLLGETVVSEHEADEESSAAYRNDESGDSIQESYAGSIRLLSSAALLIDFNDRSKALDRVGAHFLGVL